MIETIKEILINTISVYKNEIIPTTIAVLKLIIDCMFSNTLIAIIIIARIIITIINNWRKR